MKKMLHAATIILLVAPIVYLLFNYQQIPDTVPVRFDIDGNATRYESNENLKMIIFVLTGVTLFIYILLCNIWRIDPKKRAFENKDRMQKIAFTLVVFMAAVQVYIVYTAIHAVHEPRFVFICAGIFFSVMGNYFDNLKPNYFAGLRLPWALESEENWRKTHHLASRMWFIAGIVMAACFLLLPFKSALILFFLIGFIIVVVPAVYSYKLYKKNKSSITT